MGLDVDQPGGENPLPVPFADQVDLGHLAGAEFQAEPVYVGVEQCREKPAVGALGVRQAAERAEADVYDERAAADAVDDLVDEIDQVFRGTVLGGVRGGQRLLDLDVVTAGRHQVLDVPADGRDERFGAVAAVAVDRAEVQLGRYAVRAGQPDLRAALGALPQEAVLARVVPDGLDVVKRPLHLVHREHVPADGAQLAQGGTHLDAGHRAGDALDPAQPTVLAVGEDVQPSGLLVVDGQLAVVVEELLAVSRAEPVLLVGVGEDVPPAWPGPASGGGDRQRVRVLVRGHGRSSPFSAVSSSVWIRPLLAATSARSAVRCGWPSNLVSVPPASSRIS